MDVSVRGCTLCVCLFIHQLSESSAENVTNEQDEGTRDVDSSNSSQAEPTGLVLYVWLWTRWAAQRASAEVGDARFTVRAHLIFLKISCFTYAHAQIRK